MNFTFIKQKDAFNAHIEVVDGFDIWMKYIKCCGNYCSFYLNIPNFEFDDIYQNFIDLMHSPVNHNLYFKWDIEAENIYWFNEINETTLGEVICDNNGITDINMDTIEDVIKTICQSESFITILKNAVNKYIINQEIIVKQLQTQITEEQNKTNICKKVLEINGN